MSGDLPLRFSLLGPGEGAFGLVGVAPHGHHLGGPGPALLPAGEYYLAAVTDVSKDEQYDPAFLQSLISSSVRITLAPGEKRTQNLAIR